MQPLVYYVCYAGVTANELQADKTMHEGCHNNSSANTQNCDVRTRVCCSQDTENDLVPTGKHGKSVTGPMKNR